MPAPVTARAQLQELADRGPLPRPGLGETQKRFAELTAASRPSLGLGRLFEAHADAQAILAEAGCADVVAPGLMGTWASDRESAVTAVRDGDAWRVSGTKPFCSGAALVDRALVTARSAAGVELCLVDLSDPGVEVEASRWVGLGMRSTDTRSVRFDEVRGVEVGATGWYLARPGFWHGAVGVAASWLGGALGVLDTLLAGVDPDDPHQLALLGEAEATRYAMDAVLWRGADEIDREPEDGIAAQARALRIRRVVAGGCLRIAELAGEALGPRALAFDEELSQRVADLEVYVRQEHGRHDSERIGRSAVEGARRC